MLNSYVNFIHYGGFNVTMSLSMESMVDLPIEDGSFKGNHPHLVDGIDS